jgi:hypothetical protein
MAVDDLWYLRQRDRGTHDRIPSKRYGRGKRWRVRWVDPDSGETRTESFDRKVDADSFDAQTRADIVQGHYVDPKAGRVKVKEYADKWRAEQLHRDSTTDLVERAMPLS